MDRGVLPTLFHGGADVLVAVGMPAQVASRVTPPPISRISIPPRFSAATATVTPRSADGLRRARRDALSALRSASAASQPAVTAQPVPRSAGRVPSRTPLRQPSRSTNTAVTTASEARATATDGARTPSHREDLVYTSDDEPSNRVGVSSQRARETVETAVTAVDVATRRLVDTRVVDRAHRRVAATIGPDAVHSAERATADSATRFVAAYSNISVLLDSVAAASDALRASRERREHIADDTFRLLEEIQASDMVNRRGIHSHAASHAASRRPSLPNRPSTASQNSAAALEAMSKFNAAQVPRPRTSEPGSATSSDSADDALHTPPPPIRTAFASVKAFGHSPSRLHGEAAAGSSGNGNGHGAISHSAPVILSDDDDDVVIHGHLRRAPPAAAVAEPPAPQRTDSVVSELLQDGFTDNGTFALLMPPRSEAGGSFAFVDFTPPSMTRRHSSAIEPGSL
jgi:hypothetical protein